MSELSATTCSLLAALCLAGCGGGKPAPPAEPKLAAADAVDVAPYSPDPPEISRSRGEPGGVVVLWTRVIPRSDDPDIVNLANKLQERMHGLVAATLPDRPIDVRPRPERVCPRAGCLAMTAGVLLLHDQRGCAAVALLAGSGQSATNLLPWIGKVRLRTDIVPFRDPPESQVEIKDYYPCDETFESLAAGEPAVQDALRRLAARNVSSP